MKFRQVYMLLTVATLLLLAACNDQNQENTAEEETSPEEESKTEETNDAEETTEVEEDTESETVAYHNDFSIKSEKDGKTTSTKIDHDVELMKNSDRVVVLDLGVASTMAALDLEKNVVGITKGENLAPDITDVYEGDSYKDVGDSNELDFEAIKELEPQVIMISDQEAKSSTIRQLEDAAPNAEIIHVEASSTSYLKDIKDMTVFLGQMYEVEDRANNLVEELDTLIEDVRSTAVELDLSTLLVEEGENTNIQGLSSPYGFIYSDLEFTDASLNQEDDVNQVINNVNPDILLVVAEENQDVNSLDFVTEDMSDKVKILNEKTWKVNSGGYLSALHQLTDLKEIVESISE